MFDFDEMSRLYQSDPEVFEQRRKQLIHDAIESAPEPQREALRKLQYELDQIRTKQPQYFLSTCFEEMGKNLKTMSGEWGKLRSLLCEHECAEAELGGTPCGRVCSILE